jgi:hypothetical protein
MIKIANVFFTFGCCFVKRSEFNNFSALIDDWRAKRRRRAAIDEMMQRSEICFLQSEKQKNKNLTLPIV